MEPSSNENQTSSLQRIIIGVGTLIVVILTVIAAIFLAMQQQSSNGDTPTPVAQITPIPQITPTPPTLPSFTPTLVPPTDTPTTTLVPPVQTTEIPAIPPTDTPIPPPPTPTFTPVVVVVTATPPSETDACAPPPNWVAYTVQAGDTLNSLANKTNISVFDLQQINCLASSTIQPGQPIHLPFMPPSSTDTATPTATSPNRPTPTNTPVAIVPVISNVVPDRVDEDTINKNDVTITIIGRNFRSRESGFRVELRGPEKRELQLGGAASDTSFDAIVPTGLSLGAYDLVVTNPDDRAGIRENAFTIGEVVGTSTPIPVAPTITHVSPQMGQISDNITLIVDGMNFSTEEGFKVELAGPITIELAEFEGTRTDKNFRVKISPNTLSPGVYDLIVTNPDGRSDTEQDAYEAKSQP